MEKLENLRDNQGFINISNQKLIPVSQPTTFMTYINGIKYYFKIIYSVKDIYNELISEEIAKDFNIPCVHYDLADYNGMIGVICENFMKNNDTYIPMSRILDDTFSNLNNTSYHNNLTDIWTAIDKRYKNQKITEKIVNQVVNVFIYDILIANIDRHSDNFGIIENGENVSLTPLFDNEKILSELSLLYGGYSLGVDEEDHKFFEIDLEPEEKYLMKFLNVSSNEYKELLKSKLWIIDEDNIERIFERIEDRIKRKIEPIIKSRIKVGFATQLENINYTLEYTERKL